MDDKLPGPSTDDAPEATVVVRFDVEMSDECHMAYRSVDGRAVLVLTFGEQIPQHAALMQLRAMVSPRYELPDEHGDVSTVARSLDAESIRKTSSSYEVPQQRRGETR